MMAAYTGNFTNVQPNSNNIIVVSVNGEMGAMAYPVGAGNTVLLVDWASKNFWLKTTDINGVPQAMRVFQFEEITPVPQAQENGEIKELKGELAELKKLIQGLVKAEKAK